MALGFRVGRGVRIYTGGRGLGASVGTGRVRYYQHFGGGRPRSGGRAPSLAQHERGAQEAAQLREIERVTQLDLLLAELCEGHREEFVPAERPVAPPPEPVDGGRLRRELLAEATTGIRWWKLKERRAAKAAVDERLDDAVAAAECVRAEEAAELQRTLDEQWELLRANDPGTVLEALEHAFEDNATPAAPVSCEGARVDLVIRWPTIDELVPERRPGTTPIGKPTTHKRSKTERATIYLQALASQALVTVKEALAACPAIDEAGIAVVRQSPDPARGDTVLEALLLATLTRRRLEKVRWQATVSIPALLENATGRIGLRGKGANKTLFALDPDPEEHDFLARIAADLDARLPDEGVKGLTLPAKVALD